MSSRRASGESDPSASADTHRGLVLGTAGHIDHGKTALVRALTGIDCDRLPEEKSRGITIDLGFAPLDLGEGVGRISLVDVPGHERLVRTMVSGASGIDLVLLVVAADEGVMPQTREHVAICELLGLERGVVALTKCDLADEEMRELAAEDVRDLIRGTRLASAEIVACSATTGEGIPALRDALAKCVARAPARTARAGPPRLGIDRVFAAKGFGTIVTGTLVGAPLATGDTVEVHPGGLRARLRGLQTHGVAVEQARPGMRTALNLQGVEVAQLSRGEVVTRADTLTPTNTADVQIRWLPTSPAADDVVSIELLVGTAERRARLAPIGTDGFAPGKSCFARLHIDEEPLPLLPGDRFVARGFVKNARQGATVGGGVVLDVAPPRRRRSDPALLRELELFARGDTDDLIGERVRRTGLAGASIDALARELGLSRPELDAKLGELEAAAVVHRTGPQMAIAAGALERLERALGDAVARFHAAQPLRRGMPTGTLRGSVPENVPAEVVDFALARCVETGALVLEGQLARRPDHAPTLDAETGRLVERIGQQATQAGLDPPAAREWAERLGIDLARFRDLVAHLEREDRLVRAPGDLWFERAAVDALIARVRAHLSDHDTLDPAAYKQLTGTTRRTTVPLMELLDELGVTRRRGDLRVLR